MKLPVKLLEYLYNSTKDLESGLIITNLNDIIYANTSLLNSNFNPIQEENYLNKKISKQLTRIIKKLSKFNQFDDTLLQTYIKEDNNFDKNLLPEIFKNDKALYRTQLIFPIFHNNKIDGLFICFKTNSFYNDFNIEFAKNIRNVIEDMSSEN